MEECRIVVHVDKELLDIAVEYLSNTKQGKHFLGEYARQALTLRLYKDLEKVGAEELCERLYPIVQKEIKELCSSNNKAKRININKA